MYVKSSGWRSKGSEPHDEVKEPQGHADRHYRVEESEVRDLEEKVELIDHDEAEEPQGHKDKAGGDADAT